jgi:hypothetical protein
MKISPYLQIEINNNGIRKKTIIIYRTGMTFFLMAIPENFSASAIGTNLNGHQTTIPDTLNNRWEKATITAARFPVTRAARIAVTVVPMLAPIVYGKICTKVKSPAPAIGTAKEVVIELLWTMAVNITPIRKARQGVLNR